MPARGAVSAGQDWAPQAFNFGPRPTSATAQPRKVSEGMAAKLVQQGGRLNVERKMDAGSNHHMALGRTAKRLDDDHDTLAHRRVDPHVASNIQRFRQQKNLTQADLARLVNERVGVINDYEAGRAIPVESVLVRIEKALGVHLRGARAGTVMETAARPKGPPGSTVA